MSINVVTKMKVKPECVDEAIKLWASQAEKMRAMEPGLIKWDIVRSSFEANTFYCLEEFVDQAAIEFHIKQDYVLNGVENFLKLIDGEMPTTPEALATWSDVTETVVSA